MAEDAVEGTSNQEVNNDENETLPNDIQSQFGFLMQSSLPILRSLFNAMNAREIAAIRCVCKLWNDFGMKALSQRMKVETFIGKFPKHSKTYKKSACSDQFLVDQMKNLRFEPLLIIAFSRFTLSRCFFHSISHMPCLIRTSLPKNYDIVNAVCNEGLYGCSNASSLTPESFVGHLVDQIAGYLFPAALLSRSDVCIKEVSVLRQHSAHLFSATKDRTTFCEEFGWPKEVELKCILLITPISSYEDPCQLFLEWVTSFPEASQVCLVGGIVQRLKSISGLVKETNWDDMLFTAILFGGSGVFATSYLLKPSELQPDTVKRSLESWKKSSVDVWPHTDNIAFLFRCCGRHSFVNEAEAFREVFLHIPLCGLQSHGEYGWCCPDETETKRISGSARKRPHQSSFRTSCPLIFYAAFAIIGFTKP